jgi:hypothetical protein
MNILVQPVANPPQVLLIDFDRARLFLGPVPSPSRERNLRRLRRSLDKLDAGGLLVSPADVKIFCQSYHQGSNK